MEITSPSRPDDSDANATATATVDHHHYTPFDSIHKSNYDFGGVSEIIEIMEEDEENLIASSHKKNKTSFIGRSGGQQLTTISEGGIITNTTSLFSIDIHNNSGRSSDDVVYVAVGKSESSNGALLWTLKHSVHPGTTLVYLIHVFSDLKFIPSPFGGGVVPKTQVSPDLVESYMVQDTRKRRELLNKYVDICTSHRVQVETILIESDFVANAIVELISVLNIRQLVVGMSKSNLRKLKAGKGSATVADQIRQNADEGCELTIVCQGKKLNMSEHYRTFEYHLHSNSTSSPTAASSEGRNQFDEQQQQPPPPHGSFSCCFKG
ncbi:uncharacterized protein LOC110731202 [Chenopodium quinoa]|uniref:Uncharacterized protein n=1 Tax=Chenopodium quinoa TaxID=63459 RepID=A0A803M1H5_CHEQI|nr:uncharacterized protein LOC110731202 [Chenopodium quinoa]